MVCHEQSIDMSQYIQIFQLSYNIQVISDIILLRPKGELYTRYHI